AVPQTPALFRGALALYQDRPDKSWSLTDCASFLIMDQRQIAEAPSHDRHFEERERGHRALLWKGGWARRRRCPASRAPRGGGQRDSAGGQGLSRWGPSHAVGSSTPWGAA